MRYWKRVDNEGRTTTVESYSHEHSIDGAQEIDAGEYSAYLQTLPAIAPLPTVQDEIEAIKGRISNLESK